MTESDSGVIIVGAGQAGVDSAAALRLAGFQGPIVLVGEEASLPYSRPPLSKAFLAGEMPAELLHLRTAQQLVEQGIEYLPGRSAIRLDRQGHLVELDDGSVLPYSHLVLATGGDPRRLPGAEYERASNVLVLRTMTHASDLRSRMKPGTRAVIIGGGYIGLEIASAARAAGVEVTILEAAPRVLARVTSPVMSEFYQRVHDEEGVKIVLDARIASCTVNGHGDVAEVVLDDGRRFASDFVLVGIGLAPRTELAEEAGLAVDNGILVDDSMRTSDPAIFAVGDVARHPDPQHGGTRRLESVPNASEQGKCVAAAILGAPRAYDALPWFWSDQYDVKLQVAGLAQNYDSIVLRGDPAQGRRFAALYLRDDVMVAADVVNSPSEFAMCRRLITQNAHLEKTKLRDPSVPLKQCVVDTSTS